MRVRYCWTICREVVRPCSSADRISGIVVSTTVNGVRGVEDLRPFCAPTAATVATTIRGAATGNSRFMGADFTGGRGSGLGVRENSRLVGLRKDDEVAGDEAVAAERAPHLETEAGRGEGGRPLVAGVDANAMRLGGLPIAAVDQPTQCHPPSKHAAGSIGRRRQDDLPVV